MKGLRGAGIAVFAFALLAPAAHAVITRGLAYRTSTSNSLSDDYWTTSTKCPTGRAAISGGLKVQGAFERMSLGGSFPYGKSHASWITRGLNEEGDRPVHGYAVCARPGLDPTYVVHQMTIPSLGTNIAQAQCPAGREVAGGGVHVDGDPTTYEHSFPIDANRTGTPPFDSWAADVASNYQFGPDHAVVWAVCVPKSVGLHYYTQDSILAAGVGESKIVKQSCPVASDAVVAGGADVDGGPSRTHLAGSYPSDNATDVDKTPDDAWSVQVANDSAAQRTVTSYLVCRS
jgi:hypothetical protein